jgi:hypothetical protein
MSDIPPVNVWYRNTDRDEAWVRYADFLRITGAMQQKLNELEKQLDEAKLRMGETDDEQRTA